MKSHKLRPKVKGDRAVRGASLQDKSPFLNFWSQILIWDRQDASEYGHEFAMDLSRAPVLYLEIFDEKFLFFFLHLLSITYFVNLINSKPFIPFYNHILGNS
jgi:hypothetical protein